MLVKKKIQASTLLAALVVFILPWLDMQCNGGSMITQSGVQAVYGGGTLSEQMEQLADMGDGKKDKDAPFSKEDRPPPAWLAAGALLALLLAFAMALRTMLGSTGDTDHTIPILATVALGLIALQMLVGFPIEVDAREAMQKTSEGASDAEPPGLGGLGASMVRIDVVYKPWLYVELLLLAIPGILWLNDFINRRNQAQGAPAGSG